ncbi:MAG TPA: MBL fold metallo-hydrolase [Burkholderiaceae bacterium]|nr:MBL fold metallo-hydrolase [Burkholderiaceae bacterium]
MLPDYLEDLGRGVYAIDTGFQRRNYDAAYLLVHEGRAAFIDNGTATALPRHLGALQALGLAREAVEFVIPTHVHLDHAGCSGALMRELPAATLIVHPRGARHLIDPTALVESALAVYGAEELARSYGTIVGVDAARVRTTHDGMDLMLGSRRLHFIDTPGHARHHHCVWDEASRAWFSGDTFGIAYPEFETPERGRWIIPPVVPTQFEPGPWRDSIARLVSFDPDVCFLTHFGPVREPRRMARHLLRLIDALATLGEALRDAPERHLALKREITALYSAQLREHGLEPTPDRLELLAGDIELNAQGLAVWLDRLARKERA